MLAFIIFLVNRFLYRILFKQYVYYYSELYYSENFQQIIAIRENTVFAVFSLFTLLCNNTNEIILA